MYVHYGATSICQLPSCNLFTQHVTYLYGETPLVNLWTPVHSFTLIIQSTAIPALSTAIIVLITLLQTNTIFHTIRLILCFQQDRWDWQPHCTVGAKYFSCVVCRFHVVADTGSAPCQRQWHQPSDWLSFSYWSIQPRFLIEGNLLLHSSYLPLGVSQHAIYEWEY